MQEGGGVGGGSGTALPSSAAVAVRRDVGENRSRILAEGLDDLLVEQPARQRRSTRPCHLLDVEVRSSLVVVGGAEGPVEVSSLRLPGGRGTPRRAEMAHSRQSPADAARSEVSDEVDLLISLVCRFRRKHRTLPFASLRYGRAPSNSLLPLLALEGESHARSAGFADARFGRGSLRWVPRTHYPRSLDHLLAARWCRCSCSAQR